MFKNRFTHGWKLLLAAMFIPVFAGCEASPLGYQAVSRDAFPVFNNPRMVSASEAERDGAIQSRDAVIGVTHGKEAKAYPITIMGVHELGNDTIDGIPIAVSW